MTMAGQCHRMTMAGQWQGNGMAMAWQWHGNGMAMAWRWPGNGTSMAWQWHGNCFWTCFVWMLRENDMFWTYLYWCLQFVDSPFSGNYIFLLTLSCWNWRCVAPRPSVIKVTIMIEIMTSIKTMIMLLMLWSLSISGSGSMAWSSNDQNFGHLCRTRAPMQGPCSLAGMPDREYVDSSRLYHASWNKWYVMV